MSYKRFGRFYGFLQILVPISFFFYFRKKQIVKFQNIPKRAPIIFAPNHQNTLMDPFVTSIYSRRQTGFLARASAFKNPLVARILNWLKMKPVYRPRDGMENLIKNDEVFKREEKERWTCRNCGYVHEGTEPPEKCPCCKHPKEYFEPANLAIS